MVRWAFDHASFSANIHLYLGWGLAGLWVGQCIALYIVGVLEWAIVAFSNWNKEVDKAFNRMDSSDRVEQGEGDLQ